MRRRGSLLYSSSATAKKDGICPSFLLWRRRRDSNPRSACDAYTISSRAPSTRLGDSSVSMKSRGRQCRAARYSRVGWQLDEAENKTALSNCRYRAFPRKPNDKIIAQAPPFDKPFDRKWKRANFAPFIRLFRAPSKAGGEPFFFAREPPFALYSSMSLQTSTQPAARE